MPISGLVVVLDAPNGPFLGTLQAAARPRGDRRWEITDNHIAIVVDSTSNQHDQEIWQWVQELPGVLDIRIAFVGFDEATSEEQ
ncbi:MAG: hypothetical protein R3C56_02060 [Pirellulaceae bacterium]